MPLPSLPPSFASALSALTMLVDHLCLGVASLGFGSSSVLLACALRLLQRLGLGGRDLRIARDALTQQALMQCERKRQREKDEQAALARHCETTTSPLLSRHRIFKQLCASEEKERRPGQSIWTSMPHVCDALWASGTAEEALAGWEEGTQEQCVTSWQRRHCITKAAPKSSVKPVVQKQCRLGTCMCAAGPGRDVLHPFLQHVLPVLKAVNTDHMLNGFLVLCWRQYYIGDAGDMSEQEATRYEAGYGVPGERRWTQVAFCSRKPFYVVLWELEENQSGESDTFLPVVRDGLPAMNTLFEWVLSLDPHSAWDISSTLLSSSAAAVSKVSPHVWVDVQNSSTPVRVWQADWLERLLREKKRRRRRPLHEVLGRWTRPLQRDPGTIFSLSEDEGEDGDGEDNESEDDCDVDDGDEGPDDAPDGHDWGGCVGTMELIDAALPEQQAEDAHVERASCEKSSSSSSSSSSTSETSDRKPRSKEKRSTQDATHRWHHCLFTWRPSRGGKKCGWQATCCIHQGVEGRGVCTRSRTFKTASTDPNGDESQRILHLLKIWLLRGRDAHDKAGHQKIKDTPMSAAEFQEREAAMAATDAASSSSTSSTDPEPVPKRRLQERKLGR